jgi:hypothetical protein
MSDTPKCSVDGCLNGANPDFDGFVLPWLARRPSSATAKTAAHPLQSNSQIHAEGKGIPCSYDAALTLNCQRPTTMACLLDAHRERLPDLHYETPLMTMPEIATSTYLDTFGNTVRRFIAPAGDLTLSRRRH